MTAVTEVASDSADAQRRDSELATTGAFAVALVCGAGLAITARAGALALLVAVAAGQTLLILTWVLATRMPGRRGAFVIAALAAAAADVVVSVWPHGQLGALVAVLGLSLPAMIIHQLVRGAARARVTESLGMSALLVTMVVALPAVLQLRHEMPRPLAGQATSGVAAAVAGAVAIGLLVDLIAPMPRFDPHVRRGLLGVVAAAGLGCSLGYLMLQSDVHHAFANGRGAFLGAALGALAALLGVGASFAASTVDVSEGGVSESGASENGASESGASENGAARRLRPLLAVVVPLCLMMPVAFLLTLAIRV